jgi:hypothetical protein
MTILESLKSINAYPIQFFTFSEIAIRRGLNLEDTATQALLISKEYRLARADILRWLAYAPNKTEEGLSYTFTDDERRRMLEEADEMLNEDEEDSGIKYGYKGDRL